MASTGRPSNHGSPHETPAPVNAVRYPWAAYPFGSTTVRYTVTSPRLQPSTLAAVPGGHVAPEEEVRRPRGTGTPQEARAGSTPAPAETASRARGTFEPSAPAWSGFWPRNWVRLGAGGVNKKLLGKSIFRCLERAVGAVPIVEHRSPRPSARRVPTRSSGQGSCVCSTYRHRARFPVRHDETLPGKALHAATKSDGRLITLPRKPLRWNPALAARRSDRVRFTIETTSRESPQGAGSARVAHDGLRTGRRGLYRRTERRRLRQLRRVTAELAPTTLHIVQRCSTVSDTRDRLRFRRCAKLCQ
jgi:hypothetical protein